jgi:Bifunctional DNA primase/polymerase, N-terminal
MTLGTLPDNSVLGMTPVEGAAPSIQPDNSPTEFRLAMWRGGYAPLPLVGKNPDVNGKGWQLKRQQTSEREIRLWGRMYPYASNTGCLTRTTPTLDIDILDRNACRAVFEHIKGYFEGRGLVLCRSGNAPKFAVPFRTGTPFKKLAAKVIPPEGRPGQLEFLGDGQQFVVDGRHPDTGQPYRWWPADRNPSTVARSALPEIDEARAHTRR